MKVFYWGSPLYYNHVDTVSIVVHQLEAKILQLPIQVVSLKTAFLILTFDQVKNIFLDFFWKTLFI